jgi:hypothetical protein
VERTVQRIRRELGGPYGYKRFLRDGHQTVVEDVSRLHYEPEELVRLRRDRVGMASVSGLRTGHSLL